MHARSFHGRVPAFLMLACLALSLSAWGAGGFVAGVEDLPLMPGLEEVGENRVVFDKPSGRIVEALARGEVEASEVRSFYRATLPELGWERGAGDAYLREGERLDLEIADTDAGVVVKFRLAPQ